MVTDKTPGGLRTHVAIVGKTNGGKSTLSNQLSGQKRSIVSPHPGTTTDTVRIAMELQPFGPIVLLDTAGLQDTTELGDARQRQTQQMLRRSDCAVFVADPLDFDPQLYRIFCHSAIPHLLVFNLYTPQGQQRWQQLHSQYPHAMGCNLQTQAQQVGAALAQLLLSQRRPLPGLLDGLLAPGQTVLLVIPIDEQAPQGRLILPQVQLLRQCLDREINAMVVRETQLQPLLEDGFHPHLVVADSQIFDLVAGVLPPTTPLTSFSILLARQKGDFPQLLQATSSIGKLQAGDRILMLEGCTHNPGHQDIGRVKIPRLLQQHTGLTLEFEHYSGYDFPENLTHRSFALAVQCGGCMLNSREIQWRQQQLSRWDIPLTNYGLVLAQCTGILQRATQYLIGEDLP